MGVPALKLALVALNVGLILVLLAQLSFKLDRGDRLQSWSTVFYVLCLVWGVLRTVFWGMTVLATQSWAPSTFYILYWTPNPIQFSAFSLLVLFYAQVLSWSARDSNGRLRWRRRWRVIKPAYATLSMGMVGFTVVWALLSSNQAAQEQQAVHEVRRHRDIGDEQDVAWWLRSDSTTTVYRVVSSACFLTLSVVLATAGWRMSQLAGWEQRRVLIFDPRQLALVNLVLFAVFASRSVYDCGSALGLWALPDLPLVGSEDCGVVDFVIFIAWEFLPTALLLHTVSRASGRRRGRRGSAPAYGLFREIASGAPPPPTAAPDSAVSASAEGGAEAAPAAPAAPPAKAAKARSRPISVRTPRWSDDGASLWNDRDRYDSDNDGSFGASSGPAINSPASYGPLYGLAPQHGHSLASTPQHHSFLQQPLGTPVDRGSTTAPLRPAMLAAVGYAAVPTAAPGAAAPGSVSSSSTASGAMSSEGGGR